MRLLAASPTVIPYRTEIPVSTGSLVTAGLVTVLALTVLMGVLLYLRRRGWARKWLADKHFGREPGIELRTSRRLGLSTTAHVITYRGDDYLIVENGRGSTATVLKVDGAAQGDTRETP